ncbi:malate dehydrogenase [Arthrobacter sulfonylureivorans]|uniref:malate dehydrogenase n=1 Tax=Arthrobacter sulfonylureivorans TaxID=2486855 RepID=UPI0039E650B0
MKAETNPPIAGHSTDQSQAWPRSIAVIGAAGLIGSGVVYQLALAGIGTTIHLVDVKQNVARAHAIDISEAQILAGVSVPRLNVVDPAASDSWEEVDLVIVAASAPEVPGGDRRDFLAANLRLLRLLAPTIEKLSGHDGVVLLLSNPVDVLAECLHRITDISPDRILGYSINDSVRFQAAIAKELGLEPHRVRAQVLGEHGKGQVPCFSSVTVDGAPVALTASQQENIRQDIDGWFHRWSALEPGRSSGWTTPLGVVRMITMMARGETFPAAVWTAGARGLDEAFIALPVTMSAGKAKVADWQGSPEEQAALVTAAASVREAAALNLSQELSHESGRPGQPTQ